MCVLPMLRYHARTYAHPVAHMGMGSDMGMR